MRQDPKFSVKSEIKFCRSLQDAISDPWFADLVNFCAGNILPPDLSWHQRKKFLYEARHYFWDDPNLYKYCADQIIRRCIPESEMRDVLVHCHTLECGEHHGSSRTAAKVLQCGFFWPTLFRDAYSFVKNCDRCHRTGNILRRNEMPQKGLLEVEFFYV